MLAALRLGGEEGLPGENSFWLCQVGGGGAYGRLILLEGVAVVPLPPPCCSEGNLDPWIRRWRYLGAMTLLKAPPWSNRFVVHSSDSSL